MPDLLVTTALRRVSGFPLLRTSGVAIAGFYNVNRLRRSSSALNAFRKANSVAAAKTSNNAAPVKLSTRLHDKIRVASRLIAQAVVGYNY